MRVCFIVYVLAFIGSFSSQSIAAEPAAGWNVDCGNHCYFSEFPNNCQGVFYYYPDGTKSYSIWSNQYQACQETAILQANSHIISPSLIQCNCPTPTQFPPSQPSAPLTTGTRAKLEVLRSQVHSWTLCTPDPDLSFPNLFRPFLPKDLSTCQNLRKQGKRGVYYYSNGCSTGLLGFQDYTWHRCSYSGDQLSNTAEACMFGDRNRCFDIQDSFDPVTGKWFRNPFERRHPETGIVQPLFSRDALMGLLAYVVRTKDKEALRKWLIFVRNNQPKAPPAGFFNICPERPNIPKPAEVTQEEWDEMITDDRCGLVPSTAGLVYKVAIYVGLTNADLNAIGTDLYSAMVSGSAVSDDTHVIESNTAPALGPSSYQLADTADAVFLSMLAEGSNNKTLAAGNNINNRTAKLNPGYHFLSQNLAPTEYGAYLIQKYCKPIKPQWGYWFTSGYRGTWENFTGFWTNGFAIIGGNYQYYGGFGPYGFKVMPNGHDCIAWLNMYLGNGNLTEPKCYDGDVLINGACRKFSFEKPALAAIPGINYNISPWDGKIWYQAIDMFQCPYGGKLLENSAENWARCVFASGIPTSQFNTNISYSVDPDERWPGIYYSKINQQCPYGGISAGPNCQLKSYARPVISQSIRYTVDTSSGASGVYYEKINQACPWGGVATGNRCKIQSFAAGFLNQTRTYFVRSNPAYPGVYYYPTEVIREGSPTTLKDRESGEKQ